MKKIIIAVCVISIMLVSSGVSISATTNKCSSNSMPQNFNDCPINITVDEAWDMLTDTGDGIQIPVDVRYDYEWYAGYIDTPFPESPIWYCKSLLEDPTGLAEFIDMYDGEEIILYCKGGYRSLLCSYMICGAGFTGTVYNMLGGITDWIAEGYPIRNNTKPDAPTIVGPDKGGAGVEISFNLSTDDAEGDGVSYMVDWNDTTIPEWTEIFAIDEEVTLTHTWEEKGTYTIKAKAKDFYDNESDWSEITIKIPRTKANNYNFMDLLFEKFPYAFEILRHLLGL